MLQYHLRESHLSDKLPAVVRQALLGHPFIFSRRGRRRLVCRYIRLPRLDTPESQRLWLILDGYGFFKFYTTNNGKFIYLHQIVAFLCCGGREAHQRYGTVAPKGFMECHHFNGNTLDNRPENLVLLSSEDHKIVTRHQRGVSRRIPRHTFHAEPGRRTPFNRQGRRVNDNSHFLGNIIAITLFCTNEWIHNARGYLKGLVRWLERLVNRLQLGLDTSFLPNPEFVFLDECLVSDI